jgi:hypothetical protein
VKNNRGLWRDVSRALWTTESRRAASRFITQYPDKREEAADLLVEKVQDPPIRDQLARYYTAPREERWEAYMRVIKTIPDASPDTLKKIRKQLRLEGRIEL